MCTRACLIGASLLGAVTVFSFLGTVGRLGAAEKMPDFSNATLEQLAGFALAEQGMIADAARQRLREAGSAGLDSLFDEFPNLAAAATGHALPTDERTLRWIDAVEAVSRQRDAAFSRLYWHTDFDRALAEAQDAQRPILTLRLLGNLDEDRSCANSRYFRSVLYADPSVADELREHFVLHWQSVRPVPHMTIEMGDGRRIERTITGNSVHYVLDSSGTLVDVIPGLMDATAFREALDSAKFRIAGGAPATELVHVTFVGRRRDYAPTMAAIEAGERAPSKFPAELPALSEMNDPARDINDAADPLWMAALSEPTRRLMWRKRFGAAADSDDPEQQRLMHEMFAAFARSLAADTALNRLELRPRAIAWLGETEGTIGINAFNERVYAELFLTPLDDPWMGLVPHDAYVALDGEGLIVNAP